MKAASLGCVCNRSSVCVFQSVTKILSAVKWSLPHKVAKHPSRKLYATKGTKTPLKYANQLGGNCSKINLMESTKEDSR